MPEEPEVEIARRLIADLGRRITGVDDADTFVTRPHSPGELREALTGRTLTAAHRRGKTMWCETSGLDGSAVPGPDLGIHLGMSGRIVVTAPDGWVAEGGDPPGRARSSGTASPSSSPTAAGWPCSTSAGSGASCSTPTSTRSARTRLRSPRPRS